MLQFLGLFAALTAAWALMTGSLHPQELAAGAVVCLVVAVFSRLYVSSNLVQLFNPLRWPHYLAYIANFAAEEIRAHIEVGRRVLTGDISPAIVRVEPLIKSDAAKTLLANSITLTPGTVTVEAEKHLHVHWIGYRRGEEVGKSFQKFMRGVFR